MLKFAYVTFRDGVRKLYYIVPIVDIQNFDPKSSNDFDPNKRYLVKWDKSNSNLGKEADFCEANIYCLGATIKEVEVKSKMLGLKKPLVIPYLKDDSPKDNLSQQVEKKKRTSLKERQANSQKILRNRQLAALLKARENEEIEKKKDVEKWVDNLSNGDGFSEEENGDKAEDYIDNILKTNESETVTSRKKNKFHRNDQELKKPNIVRNIFGKEGVPEPGLGESKVENHPRVERKSSHDNERSNKRKQNEETVKDAQRHHGGKAKEKSGTGESEKNKGKKETPRVSKRDQESRATEKSKTEEGKKKKRNEETGKESKKLHSSRTADESGMVEGSHQIKHQTENVDMGFQLKRNRSDFTTFLVTPDKIDESQAAKSLHGKSPSIVDSSEDEEDCLLSPSKGKKLKEDKQVAEARLHSAYEKMKKKDREMAELRARLKALEESSGGHRNLPSSSKEHQHQPSPSKSYSAEKADQQQSSQKADNFEEHQSSSSEHSYKSQPICEEDFDTGSVTDTETIITRVCDAINGTKKLKEVGSKVYLGRGHLLGQELWNKKLRCCKKNTMFVNDLMEGIWGKEQLKTRTLCGRAIRAGKTRATPSKIELVEAAFKGRLRSQGIADDNLVEMHMQLANKKMVHTFYEASRPLRKVPKK